MASESLMDTQTHSVHEREHFVYQKALSSVPVDTNDRADIFFSSSFLPQRTRGRRDRATRRIKARLGEVEDSVMSLPFHVEVAFSA